MYNRKKNKIIKQYVIGVIMLSFVLTLSGCTNTKLDEGTTIPFNTVIHSSNSQYNETTPLLLVMTNEADLNDSLQLIKYIIPMPPIQIDFSEEIAILVMLGEKINTSYDIAIEKIILSENTLNIFTKFDLSGDSPKAPVGEMIISPYYLVKIQKDLIQSQYVTFNMVVDNKIIISSKYFIP